MNDLQGKYKVLLNYLKELGSVAIAFSGGVDSTFLLAAAKEALGDNVIALTAKSCLFPESESGEAQQFCKNIGVKQIVLDLGDTKRGGHRGYFGRNAREFQRFRFGK